MRLLPALNLALAVVVLITGAFAKSSGTVFGLPALLFPTPSGLGPFLHVACALACMAGVLAGVRQRLSALGVLLALVAVAIAGDRIRTSHAFPSFSIFHAVGGIGCVGVLAVMMPRSADAAPTGGERAVGLLRTITRALLVFVALQVLLGAFVRHVGAGLSIPDFPLAMGRLVPPLDSPFVVLHFSHRAVAMIVVTLAILASGVATTDLESNRELGSIGRALAASTSVQIALGAYVIWWQRDVLITVAHVVNGAAVFVLTVLLRNRVERG